MSKRLKLVSVRLKPDREVYKNATFATATDVAFLMAKEIAGFDNETIGVLNLNAKGNLLSMNVVTLNAFEKIWPIFVLQAYYRMLEVRS